jgi:RNA polymerase sigma-70 factor (ECF subfamily)
VRLRGADCATPDDRAPEADDEVVLGDIASGHQRALEELYRRHGPALLAFLSRTLDDRSLAEEIVQDTFLAVWRDPRYGGHSSIRTWLFGIAIRQRHNRLRQRRPLVVDAEVDLPMDQESPEAQAVSRALAAQLARVIAELSRPHKEVLYLVLIEQLSHAEVAEVLGIPIGTVKSRLDAARRRLEGPWRALAGEDTDAG